MNGKSVGPLYKTTITIWTEYDTFGAALVDIAREATWGEGYCSSIEAVSVAVPEDDKAWDGTEFFADGMDDAVMTEDETSALEAT